MTTQAESEPCKTCDPKQLRRSISYCRRLTAAQAKNFYYALRLLPEPKRSAMYVLYAYMRLIDDIADREDGRSIQQRCDQLDAFNQQTHAALAGQIPSADPLWPAFIHMMRRFHLPPHLFDDMIAGQRQDLVPIRLQTFDDLRQYCYRVASVVGLASIHIWGYEGGQSTHALAIDRGIAFQLTNIIRDIREDAARGRIYLPQDELAAAGIRESDLCSSAIDNGRPSPSPALLGLLRTQISRAESYFRSSAALEARIERDSRPALIAMTSIYHGILRKIARDPARVLAGRTRLSILTKLFIAVRAWCRRFI